MVTLPGTWCYRVSAEAGWPSVSIMWLGEMESWICNFYLSVAACKIVWADPSLRLHSHVTGTLSSQQTNKAHCGVVKCFPCVDLEVFHIYVFAVHLARGSEYALTMFSLLAANLSKMIWSRWKCRSKEHTFFCSMFIFICLVWEHPLTTLVKFCIWWALECYVVHDWAYHSSFHLNTILICSLANASWTSNVLG